MSLRYAAERALEAIQQHEFGAPKSISYARYLLALSLDMEPGGPPPEDPKLKLTEAERDELAKYRVEYAKARDKVKLLISNVEELETRLEQARPRETFAPDAVRKLLRRLNDEPCPCEECKRELANAIEEVTHSERAS